MAATSARRGSRTARPAWCATCAPSPTRPPSGICWKTLPSRSVPGDSAGRTRQEFPRRSGRICRAPSPEAAWVVIIVSGMALADECLPGGHVMSIDTLTADTSISRTPPQVARKNWETPIPNGIQENEVPDTGTVDMDFWDFVDIVNPLQHIPVVSTIYRELTGDTIKGVSRVIGDGLYGGFIGLVAGIGSAIVAETTGKDPGEHLMAMLTGSGDETPAPAGNTAIAEATPPSAAPAAEAAAPASPPPAAQPTSTPT